MSGATFAALAQACEYASADRIRFGDFDLAVPQGPARFFRASAEYPDVVAHMGQTLYDRYYRLGDLSVFRDAARRKGPPGAAPPERRPHYPDPLLEKEFTGYLSRCNGSADGWEDGWRVVSIEGDRAVVEKGARRFDISAHHFDGKPEPGAQGRVFFDKGTTVDGWYHVRGAVDLRTTDAQAVRIYWNVAYAGAGVLTRAVTDALARRGLPYHFKTLTEPQAYGRADAAVLYVRRDDWDVHQRLVPRIHEAVAPYLRKLQPGFTKPLAPGVGLAEDPGLEGESFGTHRCRLVAEGLWDAWTQSASASGRVERVLERLRREGVDPDLPYLQPRSSDVYACDLAPAPSAFAMEAVA